MGMHARHVVVFNHALTVYFAYMTRKRMIVLQQIKKPLYTFGTVKRMKQGKVQFTNDLVNR